MADFPSWQQGVRTAYPSLQRSTRADVAIVGGGLSGAFLAFLLQREGLNVILLEAKQLGHGATFGCSGVVSCMPVDGFDRILSTHGFPESKAYAQLLHTAIHHVAELARPLPHSHLTQRSLYLYAETEDDLPALDRLLHRSEQLGLPVTLSADAGGCPFPVERSAVLHHQYTLQPLPLLFALIESAAQSGSRIHEHSPVTALEGTHLSVGACCVEADFVVMCTGVPVALRNEPVLALLEPRLRETRVLRNFSPLHSIQRSIHEDEPGLIPASDALLFTMDRGAYGTVQEERTRLIRDKTLHALLPEARTADVILRREIFSRDGLPLIGAISPESNHILMAGGFGCSGLNGALLAAQILSGIILGQAPAEAALFRPFRHSRSSVIVQAAIKRRLRRWTHPFAPRCPHMGCPLRYHPGTRTWQCPCHGSCFDVFGQVLSAPAVHPAPVSPRDRI